MVVGIGPSRRRDRLHLGDLYGLDLEDWTLIHHAPRPGPVLAVAITMVEATLRALLVATSGVPQRRPTGLLGAV
jgi:hypothetical protein